MQAATVVIVDDVAETRASIRRLMELCEGCVVVGEASDGRDAVQKAEQLRPDCVLLDVNMPVLDGIAAAEIISVQFPEVAVVMMSVQGEQEYLRKAMAAGARDYLVKPFGPEELTSTIRRAVQMVHRRREPEVELATRTIVVAGPKGGVGRTTVAANLALGLVASGESCCLVDLNAQFSDLAMTLDIVPAQTLAGLAGAEVTRAGVEAVLEEHNSGLKVLAGPARPEEAEAVTPELVCNILNVLQGLFHWVLVDAPAQVGELVLPVFDMQPECLLIVTPELAAVRNAGQLLQLLRDLDYDTNKVRVVLNRWDPHAAVSPEVVERNLGLSVSACIPLDNASMQIAAARGVPVMQANAKGGGARAALENLVHGLQGKKEAAPHRKVFGIMRREAKWAVS